MPQRQPIPSGQASEDSFSLKGESITQRTVYLSEDSLSLRRQFISQGTASPQNTAYTSEDSLS
jgi:hypothetical protein